MVGHSNKQNEIFNSNFNPTHVHVYKCVCVLPMPVSLCRCAFFFVNILLTSRKKTEKEELMGILNSIEYLCSEDIHGKPIEAADNSLLDIQPKVIESPHC